MKLYLISRLYLVWLRHSILDGFNDIRANIYMWYLLIKEPYHPYKIEIFYFWLNYENDSFNVSFKHAINKIEKRFRGIKQ